MSPVLEPNTGSTTTLPGPIKEIICQAGQVVIVDPTTTPPTTTTLGPDDSYDGEGKAGLQILDIDGSRVWTESTLEENRVQNQMVTSPDVRPETATDLHGEPTGEEEKPKAKKKTKAKA